MLMLLLVLAIVFVLDACVSNTLHVCLNNTSEIPVYIETVGITEEIWEISNELSVRPIDFAGQLQYFLSHELFLSFSPVIVLVVANVMKKSSDSSGFVCNKKVDEHVHDWLRFLDANAKKSKDLSVSIGGPSVSIVCTFMDKVKVEKCEIANLRGLFWRMQQKFRDSVNVETLYAIDYSSKTNTLVRLSMNIRDACVRHAASVRIPSTYAKLTMLLNELRLKKRQSGEPPLISYVKICEFARQKDTEFDDVKLLNRAMDYNAAIGEVFFDPDRRLVVLSPFSYLSRFLSHFLAPKSRNPRLSPNKQAIVSLIDMQKKSQLLQCDRANFPSLMSLICSLGICVKVSLPGKTVGFLFPSKLPLLEEKERLNRWPKIPQEKSSKFLTVGRRISVPGSSLPIGAFSKVQVAVYRHCNGTGSGSVKIFEKCFLWGNAIIVAYGPFMALVDWRQDANEIDVVIRRSNIQSQNRNTPPVMFLDTLIKHIVDVLRTRYEGLEFVFKALCYRCLRLNEPSPCVFSLLPPFPKRPNSVVNMQPVWKLDSRFLPSVCDCGVWTQLNPEILLAGRCSSASAILVQPLQFEYEKSMAVVVGIDKYHPRSGLKPLQYAVNDARAVARVLKEKHEFDVVELLLEEKATRRNILMRVEALQRNCTPVSRLVVFLAGHGSIEGDGFFCPVDSVKDSFHSTMPMSDLQRIATFVRNPLHILFVLDCCFSGKALLMPTLRQSRMMKVALIPISKSDSDSESEKKVSEMLPLNQRAIQCITAGASYEPVYEIDGHGVFTKYLLSGLCGGAFSKAQKWISARHLAEWIAMKMKADPAVSQSPGFGCLSNDTGDFVFFRPRPPSK